MFTLADILEHVQIWRHIHANNVFNALNEKFGDMNQDDIVMLYEEEFEEIEVLPVDWQFDSSLNDLQDSVFSMLDTSVENSFASSTHEHNVSSILANLASSAHIDASTCE